VEGSDWLAGQLTARDIAYETGHEVHRVEEGRDPACVSSCPTRCMHFGSIDDPGSEVSRLLKTRKHKVLKPETGNEPNVYYLI
jgi:Fe-S-cluster-containing dehydrogenase component